MCAGIDFHTRPIVSFVYLLYFNRQQHYASQTTHPGVNRRQLTTLPLPRPGPSPHTAVWCIRSNLGGRRAVGDEEFSGLVKTGNGNSGEAKLFTYMQRPPLSTRQIHLTKVIEPPLRSAGKYIGRKGFAQQWKKKRREEGSDRYHRALHYTTLGRKEISET